VVLIKKNSSLEEKMFTMRNKMTIISSHSKQSSKQSVTLNPNYMKTEPEESFNYNEKRSRDFSFNPA